MTSARIVGAVLLALLGLGIATPINAANAMALPPWAAEADAIPTPENVGDADAVVLLDETVVEFAPDGQRTSRTRCALRILKREGCTEARASVGYVHPADKIRRLSAWLQPLGGAVRQFGRKDIVDLALDPESLYSECRTAMIDASAEAAAGAFFAWESVSEESPSLAQGIWQLQARLPVVVARCQLRLPKGWSATGTVLNHPPLSPATTPDGLLWEVRNLPALKAEPLAPPIERQGALLCVDLRPPPPANGRPPLLRTFASWADLAQFARARFAPSSSPTPAIRAKVQELCAGKTTPWEKTGAIAGFVQHLRYVSISANLRRNGGFIPRPAQAVISSGYGDCKDKASLLCAMLAEAGIPAYPVLCYSGDRTAVQPGWPSPSQFNHMIAAIGIDGTVTSPHIVDDPQAGRLLLFDPTAEFTPIGSFPISNQGSLVLICTPSATQLTRTPSAPASANRITFATEALLATDGSVVVNYVETDRGADADSERYLRNERAKARKPLADALNESIPGGAELRAETRDLPEADACEITAQFRIPKYAHAIRKDLLAVRPVILGCVVFPPLNEKDRTRPLRLDALEREIVAEFTPPDGYRMVDAAPSTRFECPFGFYEASTVCEGSKVIFRRKLVVHAIDLPASSYQELRTFLDAARKCDKTPVLLERR